MGEKSTLGGGFGQWLGPDGLSLLLRVFQGDIAARRELQVRWENQREQDELMRLDPRSYLELLRQWFADFHPSDPAPQRTLRAIRRNRRRVPPAAELRALVRTHAPPWPSNELVEATILLNLGLEGSRKRHSFPAEALPLQRRGRPRKWGIPTEVQIEAKIVLRDAIKAQRVHIVYKLAPGEFQLLNRCGLVFTQQPHRLERAFVPDGYVRLEADPLWLALPWQQRLFWRAVGAPEPGLQDLLPSQQTTTGRAVRVDRAARDLLHGILEHAGRSWPPARSTKRHARARKGSESAEEGTRAYLDAHRKIVTMRKEGREPSQDLYELLLAELGL